MTLHRLKKSDTLPAVGRDVDTWCTKCKADLAHLILAMVGGAPARVKCHTCGSEHKYRLSKAEAAKTPRKRKPAATTSRRLLPKKDAETMARERFARLVGNRDSTSGTAYSPRLQVEKGLLVAHATFGPGVVDEIMGTKAVVVFEDGARTLVVNR